MLNISETVTTGPKHHNFKFSLLPVGGTNTVLCECTWNAKHGSRVPSLRRCCWIQSHYRVFGELSLFLTAGCWLVEKTLLLRRAAFHVISVLFVRWWGGGDSGGSCSWGTQETAKDIIPTWSTCTTCWWRCANRRVCKKIINLWINVFQLLLQCGIILIAVFFLSGTEKKPYPHVTLGSQKFSINPLNTELNPICHFLALLGVHLILHISRIRVNPTGTSPKFCTLCCGYTQGEHLTADNCNMILLNELHI